MTLAHLAVDLRLPADLWQKIDARAARDNLHPDVVLERAIAWALDQGRIRAPVVLMCECCKEFRKHRFVMSRSTGLIAREHIYRCLMCRQTRRYGLFA